MEPSGRPRRRCVCVCVRGGVHHNRLLRTQRIRESFILMFPVMCLHGMKLTIKLCTEDNCLVVRKIITTRGSLLSDRQLMTHVPYCRIIYDSIYIVIHRLHLQRG